MSLSRTLHIEQEHRKHTNLKASTGEICYYVRLDPDCVEVATWRACNAKEYFNIKLKSHYDGLVQTKTTIRFYETGNTQEL